MIHQNIKKVKRFRRTFNIPDFANRVPQGNGHGYLSAGLPNISGNFQISDNVAVNELTAMKIGATDGAFDGFNVTANSVEITATRVGETTYRRGVSFSASRSSSVYGNSNTVQPPATKVNFVIKY